MYFLVEASGRFGTTFQIPFESRVILCGGFVMNVELLNAHFGAWLDFALLPLPTALS
jgi:hypothetical protein